MNYKCILLCTLIFNCALGQNNYKGNITYKVDIRLNDLSKTIPVAILFKNENFVRYQHVIFDNEVSTSYTNEYLNGGKRFDDDDHIEYRNAKSCETAQNITKFGKSYSKVTLITNKFIKYLNGQKIILGLKCKEISFKDKNDIEQRGWVTNKLPVSSGCIIIPGISGAVLEYSSKNVSYKAIKITEKFPVNKNLLILKYKKLILYDTSHDIINFASGKEDKIDESNIFPYFRFVDLNKNEYSNNSIKSYKSTIITVWRDVDWKSYGITAPPERDFNLVKSLDVFINNTKLNILHLAVTDDSPQELILTNKEILALKKTATIPDAANWIRTKVHISTYPTVIIIDKNGIVKKIFHYTSGPGEFEEIEDEIYQLSK